MNILLIDLFPIALVSVTILFSALFISHGGPLTRFLHQLGAFYLFFYLFRYISGLVVRFENVSDYSIFGVRQNDQLFPHLFLNISSILLAIFFYGIAERFIFSRSSDLEFPLTILLLHIGGVIAIRLHTFRDVLLSLERVTLATYVLLSSERSNRFSTYAGVQAFLLGSIPSALLLVGFSFLYSYAGTTSLADFDRLFTPFTSTANSYDFFNFVASNISLSSDTDQYAWWFNDFVATSFFSVDSLINSVQPVTAVTVRAMFLILFNMLFKLTAAPFHFWAPSVYGKGPLASVTFLSLYSKAIGLFLVFKLFSRVFKAFTPIIMPLFLCLGVFSVVVGTFGAFTETVIKRFRVYSSIGHVGFRLVAIGLSTIDGFSAAFHYLPVYLFSSLLAWFVLITAGRQRNHIANFSAIRFVNPLISNIFAFLLLSISGIPPLAGFFVKLDTFASMLQSGQLFPAYFLFFITVASFFYYLRVVKVLFFDTPTSEVQLAVVNSRRPQYDSRLWLISVRFLVLFMYLLIVQPALIGIQNERLNSVLLLFGPIAQLVRAHAW